MENRKNFFVAMLLGFFLGPVCLFLWLGRGRVAILMFVLLIAIIGLYVSGFLYRFGFSSSTYDLNIISIVLGVLSAIYARLRFDLIGLKKSYSHWAKAFVIFPLFASLSLLLPFYTFVMQPFTIPSRSMLPTLQVGDYVWAKKFTYGYSRYSFPFELPAFEGRVFPKASKRGDIVVFKLSSDTQKTFLKRIVGMPGDTVQVINESLQLNGLATAREKINNSVNAKLCPNNGKCPTAYREFLPNGKNYVVFEMNENSVSDNTQMFDVPEGHYFVMGDNRDNSLDSRNDLGFVPYENLIGRVDDVFMNSDGKIYNERVQGFPALN